MEVNSDLKATVFGHNLQGFLVNAKDVLYIFLLRNN